MFVFGPRRVDAVAWSRRQGLRPRDCLFFGDQSRWCDGIRFHDGDRIVVLGKVSRRHEGIITRSRLAAKNAPEVERYPLPTPSPAAAALGVG